MLLLMLGMTSTLAAQPTRTNGLAAMLFTNATLVDAADYAPLEWSVPELLTTRLARNPALDVVDRRRLQSLLDEQNLGATSRVDAETAARAGRLVGARYMLFGTILLDRRHRLRIDARVLDVETSRIVFTETLRDANWDDDVSDAVDSLAERINRNLRLPGSRPLPSNPSGARSDTLATADRGTATGAAGRASRSVGLITMGRALRLHATANGNAPATGQATALLRTAAQQTPSLLRDIEEILKRWQDGAK
jgi:TolB-like protein